MGCELGEERWVGRIKKSGSWRVGRGNPTLTFSLLSITVPSTVSPPVGKWICINERLIRIIHV